MTGDLGQGRRVTLRALEPSPPAAAAAAADSSRVVFLCPEEFLARGLMPLLSGLDDIFSPPSVAHNCLENGYGFGNGYHGDAIKVSVNSQTKYF